MELVCAKREPLFVDRAIACGRKVFRAPGDFAVKFPGRKNQESLDKGPRYEEQFEPRRALRDTEKEGGKTDSGPITGLGHRFRSISCFRDSSFVLLVTFVALIPVRQNEVRHKEHEGHKEKKDGMFQTRKIGNHWINGRDTKKNWNRGDR
jgi:hypothetical protein